MNERNSSLSAKLSKEKMTISQLDAELQGLEEELQLQQTHADVLSKTVTYFGPSGVQHYIFMKVIRVMERIANVYLQILAEGGIELRLKEDKNADEVLKTVSIRGADGEFRERALSQLSGGQWR